MALTQSTMLPLGMQAPEFTLPDALNRYYSLSNFNEASVLIVAFICNHCPFVKHIKPGLVALAQNYANKAVQLIAINSNDFVQFPEDNPCAMIEDQKLYGYVFPYLIDEQQSVAKAYEAACTPDFYVFDDDRRLRYRGQMDGSRPGNHIANDGKDIRRAIDQILSGQPVSANQVPSIGCSIKWKP